MIRARFLFFSLLFSVVVLSACHTKKAVLKGHPGELVDADPDIATKYSAILGIDKSEIQNGRLYAFVDQWIGTPYKYGGVDKDGVDCSALAQLLEQQVYGINIPRTTGQQIGIIKRKYEEELREGDLVFFDFDGKKFSHVGVYLQNGCVVHASSSRGVIIVKLHDPSMYSHFSRCGSIILDSEPNPESK
ncbi:NlpC/P60 family protein [soil metagenome]|jgi:probable lipoprotein NlpC